MRQCRAGLRCVRRREVGQRDNHPKLPSEFAGEGGVEAGNRRCSARTIS